MQVNEIKGTERIDIREYLRNYLTASEFDSLHLNLGLSPNRLTKMLNYVQTTDWSFDALVLLIRKLDLEIPPSEFIKQTGLIHKLTALQIEALDQLLEE